MLGDEFARNDQFDCRMYMGCVFLVLFYLNMKLEESHLHCINIENIL